MRIAEQPQPAPDAVFYDAYGNERRFRDYRGRAVLINFWATWCGPCVKEMPALNRLQQQYGGRLSVVAISQDSAATPEEIPLKVRRFYQQHRLRALEVYYDTQARAMNAFQISGLPGTVILDSRGREVARFLGYIDWEDKAVREMLEGWL